MHINGPKHNLRFSEIWESFAKGALSTANDVQRESAKKVFYFGAYTMLTGLNTLQQTEFTQELKHEKIQHVTNEIEAFLGVKEPL